MFTRSGSTWSQQAYLKASNTGAGDRFGDSVAIAGDTLVVGATSEASNATGVNGNQSDNSASGSGAAYEFARSGSTWSQQNYLKASNTDASDRFGHPVATSGATVVVGALFEASNATGINSDQADNSAVLSGAVYVFAGASPAPPTDSDSDGLSNTLEASLGSNPNKADSDGDRLKDGTEYHGFTIARNLTTCARTSAPIGRVRPNLVRADSDGDGISDGTEALGVKVNQKVITGRGRSYVLTLLQSNPLKRDTDGDGLADRVEVSGSANKKFRYARTNPANCHTDFGAAGDGLEIRRGANPVRNG